MSDTETPVEALLRTSKAVADERYYIRKDNVFQVPRGVMTRLMDAIGEIEKKNAKAET